MTWREKIKPYQGRIFMALSALILGILLLTIGFWRTLLLVILVLAGYLLGSQRDGVLGQMVNRFSALFGRR